MKSGGDISKTEWLQALGHAGIGVLVFKRNGPCLEHNEEAALLLGGSLEQSGILKDYNRFVGMVFDSALEESEYARFSDVIDSYMTDEVDNFIELIETESSSLIIVRVVSLGDDYLAALLIDKSLVYQKRLLEERLHGQNQLLLQAIENTDTGIILYDLNSGNQEIIFANQAFCHYQEKSREDILGQDWRPFFPDMKEQTSYRVVTDVRGSQSRVFGCQHTRLNGIGIILVADITPLTQKEEEVRRMQKLDSLGQLAGGIAHDFNNVLAIIRGYSDLLYRRHKGEERLAEPLTHILKACDRGAGLANKLLTFSRKKTSTHNLTWLQDITSMIDEMLLPLLPKNIQMSVALPQESAVISGENDQWMQVFMNLVVNARDAMPEGGRITIDGEIISGSGLKNSWGGADVSRLYVRIQVKDTGCGMTAETKAKIFEPFFTTKEAGKGTGLGMSIVYGLVNQVGGFIDVSSEVGQGTTFTLLIPVMMESVPENTETKENSQQASGDSVDLIGHTVMVVDDEPDVRGSLKAFLEDAHVTVLEAANGDEALEVQDMFEGTIDCLVSDVHMPGLDGIHLAELWRSVRPDSRIILMSGYPKEGSLADHEADVLLAKPVDYNRMLSLISQLLHSKSTSSRGVPGLREWQQNG